MVDELKNSAGHISFTSDIWSRQNLESYMAVTAHWSEEQCSEPVIIKSRLVAFCHVKGSHDGKNLGKIFVKILDELGIFDQLGMVTLDNATNNNAMMHEVARILRDQKIPFDLDGNRIQCFLHIINLAIKAGLKMMMQLPPEPIKPPPPPVVQDAELEDYPSDEEDDFEFHDDYCQVLEDDVVSAARNLVTTARASGQRQEVFAAAIEKFNKEKAEHVMALHSAMLRKDMDVRWSSTFLMIDGVLEFYPVLNIFLDMEKHVSIKHHELNVAHTAEIG